MQSLNVTELTLDVNNEKEPMVEFSGYGKNDKLGLWDSCMGKSNNCFYEYYCVNPLIMVDQHGNPVDKHKNDIFAFCLSSDQCYSAKHGKSVTATAGLNKGSIFKGIEGTTWCSGSSHKAHKLEKCSEDK